MLRKPIRVFVDPDLARDREVAALRAEIERLRGALRWYADPDNYDELSFQFEEPRPGDMARKALGDLGP